MQLSFPVDPAPVTRTPAADPALARLLDVRRIFVEPAAAALPRGRQVLARWPDAEQVEIASHTAVPYGPEDVDRWVRIKTEDLVLGVKKSLTARPNGRSSDFIAPSTANGCAMACAYCYVPRRKGYANPAEVILLTHNDRLHEVNLGWHPKAEDVLWRPELQQSKRSETGGINVRYRTGLKGGYVGQLTDLIAARTPWLRVRYAF